MKHTHRLLVGALAAVLSASAYACLNTYGSLRLHNDMSALYIEPDILSDIIGRTRPDEDEIAWVAYAAKRAKAQPNFENLNDVAVGLVHMGKPKEAITLLQQLERGNPGKYQTAANLGTAYELSGDNEQALKWIREGIRRNPKSHEGTEWLHVRILEAKLNRRPAGDAGHSLLGLDFGMGPLPSRPTKFPSGNDGMPVKLSALGLALRYQLVERTHFVAAPDPMVAALLTDWAHLELIAGDRQAARVLYEKAARYGALQDARFLAAKAQAARELTAAERAAYEGTCEICWQRYQRERRG